MLHVNQVLLSSSWRAQLGTYSHSSILSQKYEHFYVFFLVFFILFVILLRYCTILPYHKIIVDLVNTFGFAFYHFST